jgi:uncharacterized membrane protein
LVSSASTYPCTFAWSLWEGAATLALVGTPLWAEICFFFGRTSLKPPSVIRSGWCGWSKPTIRHP